MFREMRRIEQQTGREECVRLLKEQPRGVLSMLGDEGYPYGIPLNHWYSEKDNAIYFHCARTGHKIDAVASCDKVSYCVMDEGSRKEGDWALTFTSVVVFGRMSTVEDDDKKREICRNLTSKFIDDEEFFERIMARAFPALNCLELKIEHMTGKKVYEK